VKKPTVAAPSVGDAPPEKSPTTDAGPRILPVASPPALGANRDSPPAPDGAASGRQLQRAVAELRARFLGFTAGFGQALADLERLADLDKSP
jgi:hypothetical protein